MHRRSVLAVVAALFLSGSVAGAGSEGPAVWLSSLTWKSDDPLLGGMSAIEVAEDGLGFAALSDRGAFTTGQLLRDAAGRLTGIEAVPIVLLKGRGQAPLQKARADTEGLAMAPDGTAFVSLEGAARVLRYDRLDGTAENLSRPDAFRRMPRNASLEAVALDGQGRIYAVPEQAGKGEGPFPVWRHAEGEWDQPFAIRRQGSFLPVAADFGPDGMLYVLERDFTRLGAFAARVRRFGVDESGVAAGETILQTGMGTHDNLEGLSVWRDGTGAIRLTMIADDNFSIFLRTEIVEYRLDD